MLRLLALLLMLLGGWLSSPAEVVSWWRFESGEDSDNSAAGLSNPNEVSGEPDMVSDDATIGNSVPDLFDDFVPNTGESNTGSIRSYTNGDGNDGIFGTAAYSDTLDVNSITVEFWMRTTENEAGFVARTDNFDEAGEDGGSTQIPRGFRIVNPENVRVDFRTADADGSNREFRTLSSGQAVNQDGAWHYIAWTYDAATGVAKLYIDDPSTPVASADFTDDRPIFWGNNQDPEVIIGYQMDGNPNNNTGTLDEIRFSDVALSSSELLVTPTPVPEAGTVGAAGLLTALAGAHALARRRSRKSAASARSAGSD